MVTSEVLQGPAESPFNVQSTVQKSPGEMICQTSRADKRSTGLRFRGTSFSKPHSQACCLYSCCLELDRSIRFLQVNKTNHKPQALYKASSPTFPDFPRLSPDFPRLSPTFPPDFPPRLSPRLSPTFPDFPRLSPTFPDFPRLSPTFPDFPKANPDVLGCISLNTFLFW